MAGESVGGGGSQRVGGVHIDMTLRGAEAAKQGIKEVSDTSKNAASSLGSAAEETENLSKKMDTAGGSADSFSSNGLAGMLLKLAAVRKAMIEISDVLEQFRLSMVSGGDAASRLFAAEGAAGAETRMKAIADQSERMASSLANASDLLKNIATLDVGNIVKMFTDPAKLLEEQNRLAVLVGKQNREEHRKQQEDDYRKYQEEESAARARQIAEQQAYDEEERRKEIADARRAAEERNAEAEALERFRERGREMAKAFADELESRLDDISDKINGGVLGISNVSGSLSQLNDTMGLVARNTSRIQRP